MNCVYFYNFKYCATETSNIPKIKGQGFKVGRRLARIWIKRGVKFHKKVAKIFGFGYGCSGTCQNLKGFRVLRMSWYIAQFTIFWWTLIRIASVKRLNKFLSRVKAIFSALSIPLTSSLKLFSRKSWTYTKTLLQQSCLKSSQTLKTITITSSNHYSIATAFKVTITTALLLSNSNSSKCIYSWHFSLRLFFKNKRWQYEENA